MLMELLLEYYRVNRVLADSKDPFWGVKYLIIVLWGKYGVDSGSMHYLLVRRL